MYFINIIRIDKEILTIHWSSKVSISPSIAQPLILYNVSFKAFASERYEDILRDMMLSYEQLPAAARGNNIASALNQVLSDISQTNCNDNLK